MDDELVLVVLLTDGDGLKRFDGQLKRPLRGKRVRLYTVLFAGADIQHDVITAVESLVC